MGIITKFLYKVFVENTLFKIIDYYVEKDLKKKEKDKNNGIK